MVEHYSAWLLIGFSGQALFSARFLIQWLASERRGKSVLPVAFWYFSLGGGVTLLSYAIWRQDPVFVLGQSVGLLIYVRNLALISRAKKRKKRINISGKRPASFSLHHQTRLNIRRRYVPKTQTKYTQIQMNRRRVCV
ncbi:lipid-A-disaccharide synthase N-terminal domain-containing protein [Kiloniella majae]|uniref:lipid-A-disaccharide synthase N-terminal domain-containing protein n=1 Tax=Kiloniella majae TaxID=1938558 RepID=UPI000A2795DE|nr:lipid-A-disaccharide synthase N-terminal domain-containing protein [Kiloniella majae]